LPNSLATAVNFSSFDNSV